MDTKNQDKTMWLLVIILLVVIGTLAGSHMFLVSYVCGICTYPIVTKKILKRNNKNGFFK